MGVLKMPEIAVTGDSTAVYVEAIDVKNPSGDKFAIKVGDTPHTFKMIFKAENIKVISGDYNVAISSKGISHFAGDDVEYWIATEASSTFTKGA
jgi:hypothetical protein